MKRFVFVLVALLAASAVFATASSEVAASDPVPVRVYVPGFSDMGSDEMMVIDYIEEQIAADYGVAMDISMVSAGWGEWKQQLNLLLASEDVDIFNAPGGYMRDGIKEEPGLLAELDDLWPQYAPTTYEAYADVLDIGRNSSGDLVVIPSAAAVATNNGYWIRMDLVEKYGMDRPETLSDLEAYWDAALADGKIPVTVDSTAWLFSNLIAGSRYLGTGVDSDGKWIDYRTTPEYAEWLGRMAEYYGKGYFHQEIFTWSAAQNDEAVIQGDVALSLDGWWMKDHYAGINGEIESSLNPVAGAEQQNWVYMGGLIDENGNGVARGNGNSIDRIVGFPAFSDVTEEALTLFEWVTADFDNNVVANRGIPGVHFEFEGERTVAIGEPTDGPRYIGWLWQLDPNIYLKDVHIAITQTDNRDWLMPFDRETFPATTEYDRGFVYDTAALNDVWAGSGDLATFVNETERAAILGEISAAEAVELINGFIADIGQPYEDYRAERARQLEAASWRPASDWDNR